MRKPEKIPSPYGTRVFEISDDEENEGEESEGEDESEEEDASKKGQNFVPRSLFSQVEQSTLPGFVDSSDDEDDHDSQGEMVDFFKTIIQRQMERFNSKQQGKLTEEEIKAQNHLDDLQANSKNIQHLISKSFLLTIHLTNIRPLIWRKIKVPANLQLNELHEKVISPAMGWCGSHAYFFRRNQFCCNIF
jgi:hypothetical protein